MFPLSAWHEGIGNPTYADAILHRLVHNAHRIDLNGESFRRTQRRISSLTMRMNRQHSLPADPMPRGRDHSGIRGRNNLGTKERLHRNRQFGMTEERGDLQTAHVTADRSIPHLG